MKRLAVVIGALLWASGSSFAQDGDARTGREGWQAKVDRARQRVEKIRREASFVYEENSESLREAFKERTNRALDDEDLRPGDLVSTEGGFLRFEGISPDSKRIFTPLILIEAAEVTAAGRMRRRELAAVAPMFPDRLLPFTNVGRGLRLDRKG